MKNMSNEFFQILKKSGASSYLCCSDNVVLENASIMTISLENDENSEKMLQLFERLLKLLNGNKHLLLPKIHRIWLDEDKICISYVTEFKKLFDIDNLSKASSHRTISLLIHIISMIYTLHLNDIPHNLIHESSFMLNNNLTEVQMTVFTDYESDFDLSTMIKQDYIDLANMIQRILTKKQIEHFEIRKMILEGNLTGAMNNLTFKIVENCEKMKSVFETWRKNLYEYILATFHPVNAMIDVSSNEAVILSAILSLNKTIDYAVINQKAVLPFFCNSCSIGRGIGPTRAMVNTIFNAFVSIKALVKIDNNMDFFLLTNDNILFKKNGHNITDSIMELVGFLVAYCFVMDISLNIKFPRFFLYHIFSGTDINPYKISDVENRFVEKSRRNMERARAGGEWLRIILRTMIWHIEDILEYGFCYGTHGFVNRLSLDQVVFVGLEAAEKNIFFMWLQNLSEREAAIITKLISDTDKIDLNTTKINIKKGFGNQVLQIATCEMSFTIPEMWLESVKTLSDKMIYHMIDPSYSYDIN